MIFFQKKSTEIEQLTEIGAKVLVNLQGKIMLGVLLKIMGKESAMDLQKVIFCIFLFFKTLNYLILFP